jgi:acyl-CoA thioesterase-2
MGGAMALDPLRALLDALDLTPLADDTYEGHCVERARPRIFGGELLAQMLAAAGRTEGGRSPRALHAHFLAAGDPARPVEYLVRRARDGRRLAQRQVSARQGERELAIAVASFAAEAPDPFDHQQDPMPEVPGPHGLASELDLRVAAAGDLRPEDRAWLLSPRAVEVRQVRPVPLVDPPPVPPMANTWLRALGPLPDHPLIHAAVLAYASDTTLLDIACYPRAVSWVDPRMEQASLDHAMWFHRPFRMDEWVLYAQSAATVAGGRALVRGSVFSRDGRLVASVAQEGLSRLLS